MLDIFRSVAEMVAMKTSSASGPLSADFFNMAFGAFAGIAAGRRPINARAVEAQDCCIGPGDGGPCATCSFFGTCANGNGCRDYIGECGPWYTCWTSHCGGQCCDCWCVSGCYCYSTAAV